MGIVVVLEGRDGSGKTTTARDLASALGPATCRIIALPPPASPPPAAAYFDRWLHALAGEPAPVTIFDRSWYNRALVERVMGYCTPDELEAFFESVPRVEGELVRRGSDLVKVFFSIGKDEQERRLLQRRDRGSLSVVDASAIERRDDYERAEREMFARTSSKLAPWTILPEAEREERTAAVIAQIDKVRAAGGNRDGA